MKNKRALYLLGAILVLAVVVAAFYLMYNEKQKEKNLSAKKDNPQDNDKQKIENCCGQPAINTINISDFRDKTHYESYRKAKYVQARIENGHWRQFYTKRKRTGKESLLESLFDMSWECRMADINFQSDNGRGPADATGSFGSLYKTTIEFKLGSQTANKIEQSIRKQIPTYCNASFSKSKLLVIAYFTKKQKEKISKLLNKYSISDNSKEIVLIDARSDNKPSGSNA